MDLSQLKETIADIVDNCDSFGLLVQNSGDGGDSLQRNSHYYLLKQLTGYNPGDFNRRIYENAMSKFEIKPGVFVRHPDLSQWYSDPRNCSRDQISVAIQSTVVMDDKDRLKRISIRLLKRFGFHQNYHMGTDIPTIKDIEPTVSKLWPSQIRDKVIKFKTFISQYRVPDIVTPGELATIIRGLSPNMVLVRILTYPILAFLDLFMLGDLYFRKSNSWDYDNMLASQVLVSNFKMKTVVSILVKRLYSKTNYKDQISNYYKDGLPSLGKLYKMVCTDLIG